jgi:hypothetical protein
MKVLIKLTIVALVANAAFHVMTAYAAYYKFTDGVQQAVQFGNDKSMSQLRTRVRALAGELDVPLEDDDFTIAREEHHTKVDGSYVRSLDLLPGLTRPWTFTFHIALRAAMAASGLIRPLALTVRPPP